MFLHGKADTGNTPGFYKRDYGVAGVHVEFAFKPGIDHCKSGSSLADGFFCGVKNGHGLIRVVGPALRIDDTAH